MPENGIHFMSWMNRRLRREARRIRNLVVRCEDFPRKRKLRSFSNIHAGRDAVIVGMGPSFKPEDVERFGNMISFGCNKIYLIFEQTSWRPTYYSVCDILVAQNNRDAILNADFRDTIPIHSEVVWKELKRQKDATYYRYHNSITNWESGQMAVLPKDLSEGIYGGGFSVVIDQIQLAFAMGCSRVFLVGIDFSFSGGRETGQDSASGQVLKSEGEINHFHKEYRKPGETWTVPKLVELGHAFAFCGQGFKFSGRQLINASRTSALTVLERIPFDEIFPKQ